ncbi:MAG TPA: DUF5329 family protein [Planctomycetota bacterium]|nr:DUF5329 family protein [Planctomycetota bacterium]
MLSQRPASLLIALALFTGAAAAQDAVRLTGVPEELHVPLPAGRNVVLTAEIEKQEPRAVWLAREKDARLRCLLSRVGAGRYQVNLADPEVAAVLAAGGDSFHVFAELPDGTVISSIAVRYAAAPRLHAPPRVYVLMDGRRREVLEGPEDPFLEPALRARLTGQSIVVTADGIEELRARAGEKGSHWCPPETVQGLEFEFPKDAVQPAVEVRAGDKSFPAEASGGALRIAIQKGMRRTWEEQGSIDVLCTEAGEEVLRLRFRAPPTRLDLPRGEVELTVTQRASKSVPGSQGYEAIYLDDITGGQVRLSLATAGGERLIDERSVREGDTVGFATRDALYALTVKKLANFLVGDDYAVLAVARASPEMEEAEQAEISGLLDVLEKADVVFVAGKEERTAAQVAAALREESKRGSGTAPTLGQFIARFASRSAETSEEYRVREKDGTLVPARTWLDALAAAPQRPKGDGVGAARARAWAEAISKPGLPNLHRVGKNLYRGAQPTAPGIRELKAMGVKTIVNLRSMHSDKDLLGDTGLGSVEIPCHAWHPEEEDVVAFLKTVADETKGPFFVHCQHGADRTGMMVAIYRVVCEGWKKEDAIDEMTQGGFGFHPLWRGLPKYVREIDVDALRKKAGIPEPGANR